MKRRTLTLEELRTTADFVGGLATPMEEVERRVAAGEALVIEESEFTDPGPDCARVYLGKQQILYVHGY